MRVIKTASLLLILILCFGLNCFASDTTETFDCGIDYLAPPSDQLGGRYITAHTPDGTFLRVLVIFVEFPDDVWNPTFSQWEKGQPPNFMGTDFIDEFTWQQSTNGNLTHFNRVMSQTSYTVIGKCYHRITPNTREHYLNNNIKRPDIHKEILQDLDNDINYADYDNWNKLGPYDHQPGQDHKVDMIYMIWRNIAEETSNPGYNAWRLGFGVYQNGQYYRFSGEASLGYGQPLLVENGTIAIDMGFTSGGSGITMTVGFVGHSYTNKITIHEFGHHLLGGMEMHLRGGFWGMMGGFNSRSSCANSYERHRLGWTTALEYDYNPPHPISLTDYVTTGTCLRIIIPNTNPQ